MKIPPIEVIASWPKPNYIDPESRARAGQIIGSILVVLVTVVVGIRLYSRKQLTRGFGLDDTFICLAYIPAAAFAITGAITQESLQWGRHIWDVELKFFNSNLLISTIHLFLFDLATSLTKLSMLAMIRRLTSTSRNKTENVVVSMLAALITANCLIFITVEVFQCWPITSTWVITERSDSCIDENAHLMAANIVNTITDFIVVLLPIRTAMTLQLPPRQRVIVTGLFGIGLIASSVGIARTYFTWELLTAVDNDTTWRSWPVWITSLIELHLGIICASVPATKPFFAGYVTSVRGLTRKRRRHMILSGVSVSGFDKDQIRSDDTTIMSLSPRMPRAEVGDDIQNFLPPATDRHISVGGSSNWPANSRHDELAAPRPPSKSFIPLR
ncbi:putative integral membrane protein [Rosellinia necatrix]|uniref:Putative integral membrane protein n=1 Tax=Rosellinia necatrix TaxID=77044 RepID=A0A1W2TEU7_ROSNE|nr:putative integral membrane protein [Rosellinia necatrix]